MDVLCHLGSSATTPVLGSNCLVHRSIFLHTGHRPGLPDAPLRLHIPGTGRPSLLNQLEAVNTPRSRLLGLTDRRGFQTSRAWSPASLPVDQESCEERGTEASRQACRALRPGRLCWHITRKAYQLS